MSDNIPFELQTEIIKRVPVKSLLRCRSVSKQWKALIDSPDFADDYCLRHSQPRLLIRYHPFEKTERFFTCLLNSPKYKFLSVDDTFQQHQIRTSTLPKSANNFKDYIIVGCSHGLVCFYGSDYRDRNPMVVLWNPWIRKSLDVPVHHVLYNTIIGFGVNPQSKDLKIVKVNSFHSAEIDTSVPVPCRVEVFTLSSGTWKTLSCSGNNLPCRNSIIFCWRQVALDGVIYWLAFERINLNGGFRRQNLIISFDLSSERFQEVCLPDYLARLSIYDLSISKRIESVVVLERNETGTSYDVWMMGQGVTKSFTKLFTVMPRGSPFCTLHGFMKNGEPIVDHGSRALFAYESDSDAIKDLGIVGHNVSFNVKSYMETLLLIDQ